MTAVIRIRRESDPWARYAQAYRIRINGVDRGSVERGKIIELPVEPGHFEVQALAGWYVSESLTGVVTEGQVASFVVTNGESTTMVVDTTKFLHLRRA